MFLILLLLFIFIPMIEIMLFMKAGAFWGLFFTVGLTIFTAALGAYLVRTQGVSTMMNIQKKMQQGETPALDILAGLLLGLSGILLITPGFFTDIIGFLLLIPTVRKKVASYLAAYFSNKMTMQYTQYNAKEEGFDGSTFDGEYTRKETQKTLHPHRNPEDSIIEGEFEEKK